MNKKEKENKRSKGMRRERERERNCKMTLGKEKSEGNRGRQSGRKSKRRKR